MHQKNTLHLFSFGTVWRRVYPSYLR